MINQKFQKDINLGFDLSEYIIKHPDLLNKIEHDNFVIFVEGKNDINQRSQDLLKKILKRGETVVKAIRKNTKLNKWNFEIVRPELA